MNLKIIPSILQGNIKVPSSKSLTHRALICAAIAEGKSIIHQPLRCDDTFATINALKTLGANFDFIDDMVIVSPIKTKYRKVIEIDCNESASTLRMLLPILSLFCDQLIIHGSEVLITRVMTDDLKSLTGLNFKYTNNTIYVSGKLTSDSYQISGQLTSQLISGMIFCLPFLKCGSKLILDAISISNPYLNMSFMIAEAFGIKFLKSTNCIALADDLNFKACEIRIEGDYSHASFWLSAAVINPKLTVSNLLKPSVQGDIRFLEYLNKMGVDFSYNDQRYFYKGGKINSAEIDISETPDLGPILVAIASLGSGIVIISGVEKLQYKESNRNLAITEAINRLGGDVRMIDGKIIVYGKSSLNGGVTVNGYHDHRIVMALTVIASKCKQPFVITDYQSINKSYPAFLIDYQHLGGKAEEVL